MKLTSLPWIVALAALLAALVYYKSCQSVRRSTPPPGEPGASRRLSQMERKRVRAFWESYRRAGELRLGGQWRSAIAEYRRALELDPVHEDSLYNLANCHLELGEFQEALAALRRLVATNPMSHRGHHQIGLIHSCPGAGSLFDLGAAREALTRAFQINKEESGSLLRLGEVALVQGDSERAFELFSLANRSNFRAVEGYYLRAYIRWRDGRPAEARSLLMEALRQSRKPVVVAAVPGEGDRAGGSVLPPTTLDEKRLLRPFWSELAARLPRAVEQDIDSRDLETEFAALQGRLGELAPGR